MKFEKFAEKIEKSLIGADFNKDLVVMNFNGYAYPIGNIGIRKMFENLNTGKREIEEKYLFTGNELLVDHIDKNNLAKAKLLYSDYDVFYYLQIWKRSSVNDGKLNYNISPVDFLEYEFNDADFDKIEFLNSSKNNVDLRSFKIRCKVYQNQWMKSKYENSLAEYKNNMTGEIHQHNLYYSDGSNGIPTCFKIVHPSDGNEFIYDNNFIKNGHWYDIEKFGLPSGIKQINENTMEVKNDSMQTIRVEIIEDPVKNFKDIFEGWF